jgi:membrane protein DedA with SNARE-associated domain
MSSIFGWIPALFHGLTSWIHPFLNWILYDVDPVWKLAVVGLLVFSEDALFVGFVIPGESAAVIAGVASGLGQLSLTAAIVVVIIAAIAGDTVGYELGKHLFSRVRGKGFLAKHESKFVKTEEFLHRRGAAAVFLGRFVALFRALMPAIAGASKMHYPVFLRWNALGGIVWGTTFVLVGHAAGKSWQAVAHSASTGLMIGVGVIVALALVAWQVHEFRKRRREGREAT